MIRVAALSMQVPGFQLTNVSFAVGHGGVGVVTGPTGAGKTTLIETIAGVRRRRSGTVTLNDIDVSSLPPERRGVGLVYQQAWLFPHLSVKQNVSYAATQPAVVDELIDLLRLRALLEKPVITLSGGERQLVAIARALARLPRILLLDEPFAAMDSTLRADVRSGVLHWASAREMTTLLVTHAADEAGLDGAVKIYVTNGTVSAQNSGAQEPLA
jgi:ABC-type sulfate/molybdate transport systems ATPase subunit